LCKYFLLLDGLSSKKPIVTYDNFNCNREALFAVFYVRLNGQKFILFENNNLLIIKIDNGQKNYFV
jgi:hypothetical protein